MDEAICYHCSRNVIVTVRFPVPRAKYWAAVGMVNEGPDDSFGNYPIPTLVSSAEEVEEQ